MAIKENEIQMPEHVPTGPIQLAPIKRLESLERCVEGLIASVTRLTEIVGRLAEKP